MDPWLQYLLGGSGLAAFATAFVKCLPHYLAYRIRSRQQDNEDKIVALKIEAARQRLQQSDANAASDALALLNAGPRELTSGSPPP